jgi:hypothetical protein
LGTADHNGAPVAQKTEQLQGPNVALADPHRHVGGFQGLVHDTGQSIAAMAGPLISSGVMTAAEEARLEARLDDPDFLGCGFAFIGAWGRRPPAPPG